MQEGVISAIDSLRTEATATIFGAHSSLADSGEITSTLASEQSIVSAPFTSSVLFSTIVAITALLYILWISRLINLHKTDHSYSGDNDRQLPLWSRVLRWILFQSLIAITLFIAADELIRYDPIYISIYDQPGAAWILVAIVAFSLLYMTWGAIITIGSHWLSTRERSSSDLSSVKESIMTLSMLTILPIALLTALNINSIILRSALAIGLIGVVFFYFFKTFLIFRARKISILLWFLYLCAVEFVPITFVWIFVRNIK